MHLKDFLLNYVSFNYMYIFKTKIGLLGSEGEGVDRLGIDLLYPWPTETILSKKSYFKSCITNTSKN